mmetsp:Transcript_47275/g.115128  ORF Transcript_47275/g.115128 Transcript_47275/m.115128 type:complete len:178 (+) Transcript_47275:102-635(+)
MSQRSRPNVLVTGTPGTGKTTTAERVAAGLAGFRHHNVGQLVKEKGLHGGKHEDVELDTFVLDEDKVCDELEDLMEEGGNVVDFHTCDFFPERWFDLVVVLRTENDLLYPRLEARGYSQKKVQENVECEIMCVVAEEARESYKPEILWELQSNTVQDLEANVARIVHQMVQWGCTQA